MVYRGQEKVEVVKWMWKEYGVEYLIALCHILCIALLWNGIGLTECFGGEGLVLVTCLRIGGIYWNARCLSYQFACVPMGVGESDDGACYLPRHSD
jgi:hypothetical protein